MSCKICNLKSGKSEMLCWIGKKHENPEIKFLYNFDVDDCMCLCFSRTSTNFSITLCEDCVLKIASDKNYKIDKNTLNDVNVLVNGNEISNEIFRAQLAHILANHFNAFSGRDRALTLICDNNIQC